MGTTNGNGGPTPDTPDTPAASSRRGLLAAALAAVLGGATGGLRGDLRVAAEEAGMVLRPDEAWEVLVGDGGTSEGTRDRHRHVRVRFKRRTKTCRGDVGDTFLTCGARCRKNELMMSGGCLYAGPDQSQEAMNLVQSGPLNRQTRYGCQWTSFPDAPLTVPVRYQAVVVCRSPKRG